MHKLSVDDDLVYTNTVVNSVCGVCCRRNLNLTPLLVSRYKFPLQCALLELRVYALVFNAALALDEW